MWDELLEKQKDVKTMINEDFVAIKQRMEDEEQREKIKNTTLKEIQQQQEELSEIAALEKEINERRKHVQEMKEQLKKLTGDVPEAGFTVDDDPDSLSAKHYTMQCDLQQKRNHLQM